MNALNVSVVVVTYNRLKLLKEVLDSLIGQTFPLHKIYVVDNASTDGTDQVIPEEYPKVIYKKLDKNYGGAYGFYAGIAEALNDDSSMIWILDDDAVPQKDALEILMSSEPLTFSDCVGLSSTVIDYEDNILLMTRRNINLKTLNVETLSEESYKEPFSKVDLVSFVGLMVSKDAVRKAGLPRKDFFYQFDDTEYSLRLNKFGKMYNINKSIIVHPSDNITKEEQRKSFHIKDYYNQRNRIYTYKEYSQDFLIFTFRLTREILLNVSGILFYRNNKIARLRVYFAAVRHGLIGKMGINSKIHGILAKCQK